VFKINIYAENRGWLFEDLKQHFKNLKPVNGFEVFVSDQPLDQADVWVALRTKEAVAAPDIRRTVVCVHDLLCDDGMYQRNGSRRGVCEAGALVLCHPEQRRILIEAGISLERTQILERPIGALKLFTPRQHNPDVFTVGWVGRAHPRKRWEWFVEAIRQSDHRPEVVLIGSGLGEAARSLHESGVNCCLYDRSEHPISNYPRLYQGLDCLVITSSTEAGPITLFEALATGLPVVSTPVGWAPYFSGQASRYVRLAGSPREIASHLKDLRDEREEMFERRFEIAELVSEWTLESWLRDVVKLAGALAHDCGRSGLLTSMNRVE
jgi:glycosyltransferase involved in cell wall biosynthesis